MHLSTGHKELRISINLYINILKMSMRKRNLPKLFAGSVQQNYWGFITKSDFFYNRKDPIAMKYLIDFERRVSGKFKQKTFHPNFEFSIKEIRGVDNHSYIQHTWITNMTQKFYLHQSSNSIHMMYKEIGLCNAICDNQRQYEGFDDEYEDEDKQLI